MKLQEFARKNRLNVRIDKRDSTEVVQGRCGQIYEYEDGSLAVMFLPSDWCPRKWTEVKKKGAKLGMDVVQNGDSEGCLRFDPTNREQTKLAMQISGVKTKRNISKELAKTLSSRLFPKPNFSELSRTIIPTR